MTKLLKMGAAAAALTVMTAVAAQAADLPTKKAPVAPVYVPPPFTWTGFYVGVNAGGVWATGNTSVNTYWPGLGIVGSSWNNTLGNGASGFIGGGQAGYNFQSGAAVFGIETDFDGTSLSKSKSVNTVIYPYWAPILGDSVAARATARLNWLGTTRARVGFVATPDNRLMFYGTGGVAYGGANGNASIYDAANEFGWYGSKSSTRVGWTIGAGAEYAVTNNVTIKGEYLYYSLGSSTATIAPVTGYPVVVANGWSTYRTQYNGSIFRAGINYKF